MGNFYPKELQIELNKWHYYFHDFPHRGHWTKDELHQVLVELEESVKLHDVREIAQHLTHLQLVIKDELAEIVS